MDGFLNNKKPTVTTDPNKLQAQARKHLGDRSYDYVAGGAGEKATMDANRLAFRQWKVCCFRLCSSSLPSIVPVFEMRLTVTSFGDR